MKTTQITATLFDPSLTPHNARARGYKYIDDVIYDQSNPSEFMIDILEFAKSDHCKFGAPGSPLEDTYYGLYVPLGEEA